MIFCIEYLGSTTNPGFQDVQPERKRFYHKLHGFHLQFYRDYNKNPYKPISISWNPCNMVGSVSISMRRTIYPWLEKGTEEKDFVKRWSFGEP